MLPNGKILLEKKLTRQELVGKDDTITDEVDGFLYVTTALIDGSPLMVQLYVKEPLQMLWEMPYDEFVKRSLKAIVAGMKKPK